MGSLFLAVSTSLPEVATSLTAVRLGAIDLAISNALGSNLFNVVLLTVFDLADGRGNFWAAVSSANALGRIFEQFYRGQRGESGEGSVGAAVEHGAAAPHAELLVEDVQTCGGRPVTVIEVEAVRLHHRRRADIAAVRSAGKEGQEVVQAAHRMHHVPLSNRSRASGDCRRSRPSAGSGSLLTRKGMTER